MGYTKIITTMKWWYPHKNKLKYCPSANFDEHKNIFFKGWSTGSNMLKVTDTSDLPTIKIYISGHPLY